ncbi:hypothetical protein J7E50_03335 [Pedobacter sp. ISL-68]|uniref:hypothetical protein n=1 Tax=unclassified Pedobacter TaxID=2628915 RepID=UPI001BE98D8A|nr:MULTISPECIES: hypothetical protein [unclassified Pedobacter]MBT2560255.1 hypothetical protein [Pedobacter sp. ISL-64]MBT2589235.1 hypothetical protein [Pedobacter sp. ISL-68]
MKNLTKINETGLDQRLMEQEGKAGQDAEHHLLEDFFELYVKVLEEIYNAPAALPINLHPVAKFSSEEALVIAVSG